jgi:membrane-bound lytic murein transglycosylase D
VPASVEIFKVLLNLINVIPMRVLRILVVCLSIVMIAHYPGSSQSGATQASLTVPARLRARVDFWKSVFTKYGKHYVLVHHKLFPQITFDIIDMSVEGALVNEIRFDNIKKERVNSAVSQVKNAIIKLSEDGTPTTHLEKNIAQKMEAVLGSGLEKYKLVLKDDLIRTQTGIREKFRDSVVRSGRYITKMEAIFKHHGLPVELTRLPFIESSFDYTAYSSVGAAGIWQFMRRTALNYMVVNSVIDQRRDPIIATHAAAKYLREAYRVLGNWPQAVTSYNHGVGGVRRKMNVSGLNSLADLIEHPTRNSFGFASSNFFPEFLAACEVYRDYKKYFPGLVLEPEEKYVERRLTKRMNIESVARLYGYSAESLKAVNYSFASTVWSGRTQVPSGAIVKFPVGGTGVTRAAIASNGVADLQDSPANLAKAVVEKADYSVVHPTRIIHIVRRGETVSSIAQRYRTSVAALLQANRLRQPKITLGQKVIVPVKDQKGVKSVLPKAVPAKTSFATYIIRRGDTIGVIATRFKILVAELKTVNAMRSNRITIGQKIKIPQKSGVINLIASKNAVVRNAQSYYVVRAGDSLWSIAKRHGSTQSQLLRLNGPKVKRLMKGQRVRVR